MVSARCFGCSSHFFGLSDPCSDISVDLPHVKLLHVRAELDAVVLVPFLVVDLIAIQSQLLQLVALLQAGQAFKLIDMVVR